MSRHRLRRDLAPLVLLGLAFALAVLIVWLVADARADCLAGRIVGPWC